MSSEHPALKNFSPTWEGIKHIGGKALKYAAIGALTIGALAMLPGAAIGALSTLPLGIGSVLSGVFSVTGIGSGSAMIGSGLLLGATVGGVAGGLLGAADVGKAVDERKQDAVADYEQAMVSRERAHLMAQQRGQGYSGGVSPSSGYGRGRGQGAELQ